MNRTVISGTPRTNSMKRDREDAHDRHASSGGRARAGCRCGSDATMPTMATTSVTSRPPQSGVSTGARPKSVREHETEHHQRRDADPDRGQRAATGTARARARIAASPATSAISGAARGRPRRVADRRRARSRPRATVDNESKASRQQGRGSPTAGPRPARRCRQGPARRSRSAPAGDAARPTKQPTTTISDRDESERDVKCPPVSRISATTGKTTSR